MTSTEIRTALQSHTTATQERIILRQIRAHIQDYLDLHDLQYLSAAISRCNAGERRGGAQVETFRRLRAKVMVASATGRERVLESAIDLVEGEA